MMEKRIAVDWKELQPMKEWYFFTSRSTIWKVVAEKDWMYKNLIDFAFNDETQYIKGYTSHPYWNRSLW